MQFLYPNILYGLTLIAIPVIIHLFRFRRFKTIYFSNTAFLQQIQQEKKSSKRLKHLIALFLRILTIIALVLAFAQPYSLKHQLPGTSDKEAVSIYIDNSLSMQNTGKNGPLINDAKQLASKLVAGFPDNTQINIITNSFDEVSTHFIDKNSSLEFIGQIDLAPTNHTYEQIYQRQKELLSDLIAQKKSIIIISDFQENTFHPNLIKPDSLIHISSYVLQAENVNNIIIDSAWLQKPVLQLGQQNEIVVKVSNSSDEELSNRTVFLYINGAQKALSDFNMQARSSKQIVIPFTMSSPGWNKVEIKTDDYPLTFDDNYYLTFFVRENYSVLEIYSNTPSSYIDRLFDKNDFFKFNAIESGRFNPENLSQYDLVILNEIRETGSGQQFELTNYLNQGGSIFMIPPRDSSDGALAFCNAFLSGLGLNQFAGIGHQEQKISYINKNDILYKSTLPTKPSSLPDINQVYNRKIKGFNNETCLLGPDKHTPLLSKTTIGNGILYVSNVPLVKSWSGFPENYLFVISLYQMAIQNGSANYYSYLLNHSEFSIENQTENGEPLVIRKNQNEFIPQQVGFGNKIKLFFDENFISNGFYSVYEQNNKNPETVLALNYDRDESKLSYYTQQELKETIFGQQLVSVKSNIGNINFSNQQRLPIWKLLLISALILLVAEQLLIRLWK